MGDRGIRPFQYRIDMSDSPAVHADYGKIDPVIGTGDPCIAFGRETVSA
jgi:hypothetical protein